jgi:arginyl-tRNA---protein transferase
MHYRLNGTLVAVAVLDILPESIVSVYFFWDRTLEHLNLGTYSALNELEFARAAGIKYYCLGWYVHTSKKMNYKSSFQPTEILCPDTLTYVPLDASVREKLDLDGYARLDTKVR